VSEPVSVVDLFAGPGGLGEGFAALRDARGRSVFRVALSVEKDRDAHRTLRLRAFLRQFREFPEEYYGFLHTPGAPEPDWAALYPGRWAAACRETLRLTLGTPEADRQVDARVKLLRSRSHGRTVLLGGPPCQSYSVIGRSRNAGSETYSVETDERLWLYRHFARVMGLLKPVVAVMENVTGLLSARAGAVSVFPLVLRSLRLAAESESRNVPSVWTGGPSFPLGRV